MAVKLQEFKDYVGTKDASDFPQFCLTAGHALVTSYIGTVTSVPQEIHDQAVLKVSSELYHARNAPNGIAQFADANGAAVRIGYDPLAPAYKLLRPFLGTAV
jgi:hypothetical protein